MIGRRFKTVTDAILEMVPIMLIFVILMCFFIVMGLASKLFG